MKPLGIFLFLPILSACDPLAGNSVFSSALGKGGGLFSKGGARDEPHSLSENKETGEYRIRLGRDDKDVAFDLTGQNKSYGGWNGRYYQLIENEAARYPALFGSAGLNPLGQLCTNYGRFSYAEQKSILARLLAAMAFSESNMKSHARDTQFEAAGQRTTATGLWQISPNSRDEPRHCDWPANTKAALHAIRTDIGANVNCIFKMFTNRLNAGLPIYGESGDRAAGNLPWSILRDETHAKADKNMFRLRLVPTFNHFVPECHNAYGDYTKTDKDGELKAVLPLLPGTGIPLLEPPKNTDGRV